MAQSNSIGPLEQLVLASILTLDDNAYGISIHAKVRELIRTKKISLGAIYVTVDRLEDRGFISSRLSAPTSERGGCAKRCYRLESAGERALRQWAAVAKHM
jgi:PadR family transcriptional regulator PadR